MRLPRSLITAFFVCLFAAASTVAAQEQHPPARPGPESAAPQGAQPAHPPDDGHAGEAAEGEQHDEGIMPTVFRLANFAILAGVLVYFLRTPIATYLASRGTQIRQELVGAADMRATATAQLSDIERKMQALPAELDALKRQGAEDVKAEQARITHAAAAERERLLEQTRREIDMRLRIARRELTEHAARLAVTVAEKRIRGAITAEDQVRLVDRYASQLREAR